MNWDPSSKFCAGSAHIGWAAAAILGASSYGCPLWLSLLLFLTFASLKEFWADLTWLERDSIYGSCFDFVTYCVGVSIGVMGIHHFLFALFVSIVVLLFMMLMDMDGILTDITSGSPPPYD